ncbi:Transcription factor protein [Gossypium arboreum]|uniref:Transcription factor protein n=1 Tax=Gossypium arboreum TaxID=29729 RepID=A0A0B0M6M5_GOSAR|nr:Transcription factor protein [Gossypium arboreum]KHG10086.1 Transcription factor protein [Gossypium arboreum]
MLLDRKDKVGERIVTLQQLVSPYGKSVDSGGDWLEVKSNMLLSVKNLNPDTALTDTASVLLQAMEYIQFLHEQVKVLSAPYLQTSPTNNMQASIKPAQEQEHYSLRSQGLCLVPLSYTMGVVHSNGADIWAPIKTASPKFDKPFTQFN